MGNFSPILHTSFVWRLPIALNRDLNSGPSGTVIIRPSIGPWWSLPGVTRWLHYLFNIRQVTTMKFGPIACKICPIRLKISPNPFKMIKDFQHCAKWPNFAKSGHTDGECGGDPAVITLKSWQVWVCPLIIFNMFLKKQVNENER